MIDRTRIAEYEKVTELDSNHKFSIDLLDTDTNSVTYDTLSKIVVEDIANAKNSRLIQQSIDGTKHIYNISTVLYAEKGISTELYDGYTITVNEQSSTLIPQNWQGSYNDIDVEPNILLSFNNTEPKPLYNGYGYKKFNILGLDYNTLWGLRMDFTYNLSLDCWLVFKYPESFTLMQTLTPINKIAGVFAMSTNTTDITLNLSYYPVLGTYLTSVGLGTTYLPNFRSCTICGLNNNLMDRLKGQVETGLSSIPVGNVNLNGSMESLQYNFNNSIEVYGIYSLDVRNYNGYGIKIRETPVYYNVVQVDLIPTVTSTDTNIKTSVETLARRVGTYGGFVS